MLASLYPVAGACRSFAAARERAALLRDDQLVRGATGRQPRVARSAQIAMGYAAAAIIVAGSCCSRSPTTEASRSTFFTSSAWHKSFPEMIHAFWTNIWVAVRRPGAGAGVRAAPRDHADAARAGRGAAALIALVYCDVFRAIPAIVVILLVVFGTPLAFPATSHWPRSGWGSWP